jgi:hypothetical protein
MIAIRDAVTLSQTSFRFARGRREIKCIGKKFRWRDTSHWGIKIRTRQRYELQRKEKRKGESEYGQPRVRERRRKCGTSGRPHECVDASVSKRRRNEQ